MNIQPNNQFPELQKIEELLYGLNYQVGLLLYGPFDSDIGLKEILLKNISEYSEIKSSSHSTVEEFKNDILNSILFEGDESSGPKNFSKNKNVIISLIEKFFTKISINYSDMIICFHYTKGFPGYPVFWDFSYDLHINNQRWIFIGYSSD